MDGKADKAALGTPKPEPAGARGGHKPSCSDATKRATFWLFLLPGGRRGGAASTVTSSLPERGPGGRGSGDGAGGVQWHPPGPPWAQDALLLRHAALRTRVLRPQEPPDGKCVELVSLRGHADRALRDRLCPESLRTQRGPALPVGTGGVCQAGRGGFRAEVGAPLDPPWAGPLEKGEPGARRSLTCVPSSQ